MGFIIIGTITSYEHLQPIIFEKKMAVAIVQFGHIFYYVSFAITVTRCKQCLNLFDEENFTFYRKHPCKVILPVMLFLKILK